MRDVRLVDVEWRHREYPESFEIATRYRREGLWIEDMVKLIVEDRERMWFQITQVFDDEYGVSYIGTLANHPAIVNMVYGEEIRFGPQHIADIMAPVRP